MAFYFFQLLVFSAWLVACSSGEQLRNYCSSSEDCPLGYRCDQKQGLCLCTTDQVCRSDEYCHADGRCRRRLSCDSNLDCPEDSFCDTIFQNCLETEKCSHDLQCSLGHICSDTYFRCIPGCRQTGDCLLGEVCRMGNCLSGLCDGDSFCDYGQRCDSSSETCFDDTRGPFCDPCKPGTIVDPDRCGEGPNFCVMTNNDPSLEPFCGVDCNHDQPCPWGYECSLILVAPGGSCRTDQECESEKCHINEGDQVGFCLCSQDDQCPQDSCDESFLTCRISRTLCMPGSNDCRPLFCIDGLCLIGRNCTPKEGLECADFNNG